VPWLSIEKHNFPFLLLGTSIGGAYSQSGCILPIDRNSQPISKSLITIAVSGSCRFTTASVFPVLDLPKSANSLPILIFPVRLCQSASITPDHCVTLNRYLSFPLNGWTGQPLIYASLGTVQNTKEEIFYCIAAACATRCSISSLMVEG